MHDNYYFDDEISNINRGSKIERIYRILLSIPKSKRSWYKIAKMANVSYGWAYNILSKLQDDNIIRGSNIKRPKQLFLIWVKRPTNKLFRQYHIQNPKELLYNINLDYALTTYYAEQLVGNYLFPTFYDIYIHKQDANKWHLYLSKIGFVGKGNLRVFLTDEHVFWNSIEVKEWPIVSIQQLIVDLLREGAECREAAEILIRRFYRG